MNNNHYNTPIMGLLVIVAPLFYTSIGQGCFILLYLSLIGLALYFYGRSKYISLTKIDCCVTAYLVYGFCNMLFVKANGTDCLFLLQWLFLLSVYLLSRGMNDKKSKTLYFIALSGAIQAIIGILQLMDVIESGHSDFPLTGSFPNPGPYGGYLTISLLSVFVIFIQTKQKAVKLSAIALSVLLFVMLLLSGSRAALLALICSVLYLTYGKIRIKSKTVKVIGVAMFLLVSCVVLYLYRTGSADARLLIWRVCGDIFADNPLIGKGVASLSSVYMNYQADYFINNPDSIFTEVANNHFQAFNEFIHIVCEQGIIGLFLFLAILFFVFKSYSPIKAPFLALLVFSCFSYPSDVLSLKLIFPLFIGLSANDSCFQFKLPRLSAIVLVLLLIPFVIYAHVHYERTFNGINDAKTAALSNNKEYMLQYAKKNNDTKTLTYLTKNIGSTSEILCDMGDAYLAIGDTLSADSCYKKAFHMVPNRILPLYNLFLIHKDTIYARKIINFKPQTTNSLTLRAKAQSKEYLKLITKNYE